MIEEVLKKYEVKGFMGRGDFHLASGSSFYTTRKYDAKSEDDARKQAEEEFDEILSIKQI